MSAPILNEFLKAWSKKDLFEMAQNKNAIIADLRKKLAEAEQRAKVIELALALAAENHRCEGCPSKKCDGSIRGTQKCRDTIASLYIVQAEQELVEDEQ